MPARRPSSRRSACRCSALPGHQQRRVRLGERRKAALHLRPQREQAAARRLAVLAVLALLPRGPRILVTGCWIVALTATLAALLISLVEVPVLGGTGRPGLGVLVVLVQAAFVTAVVLGGEELTHQVRGVWRRVVAVGGAVLLGSAVLVGTPMALGGFLLVRSVGEALDELAALVSIYSRPGQIAAARRRRRPMVTVDPVVVKPLLAPGWLPYRHGLDFLSDFAAALTLQAQDVAERRRAAKLEAEGGPVGTRVVEEDELAEESGLLVRFLTNPVAVLLAVFVVAALVGAREAFGQVSGGALSPAPEAAASWWRTYTEHWHPLLTGTDAPAPPYLLPMAVGGTLLGGRAPLLVSLILVLAVPIALWGTQDVMPGRRSDDAVVGALEPAGAADEFRDEGRVAGRQDLDAVQPALANGERRPLPARSRPPKREPQATVVLAGRNGVLFFSFPGLLDFRMAGQGRTA